MTDPTAFKSRVADYQEKGLREEKENAGRGKEEEVFRTTFERMNRERDIRFEQIRLQAEQDDMERLKAESGEERRLLLQTSSFDPLDEMLFTNSFVSESDITSVDIKRLEEEDDMLRVYKQTLFQQLDEVRRLLHTKVPVDKEVSSATHDIEALLRMEENTNLITLEGETTSLDSDNIMIDETLIAAHAQVPLRKLNAVWHQHQMDEEELLLADMDVNIAEAEEQARLMVEQREERIRLKALEKMMESEDDLSIIATKAEQTLHEATEKAQQKAIAKQAKRALRRAKKEACERKQRRRMSSEPSSKAVENETPWLLVTAQEGLEEAAEMGRLRADEASIENIRSENENIEKQQIAFLKESCAKEAAFVATQIARIRTRESCAKEAATVAADRLNEARKRKIAKIVVNQQAQKQAKVAEQSRLLNEQEEEMTSSARGLDGKDKSVVSNNVKFGLLAAVAIVAGNCVRTARKSG